MVLSRSRTRSSGFVFFLSLAMFSLVSLIFRLDISSISSTLQLAVVFRPLTNLRATFSRDHSCSISHLDSRLIQTQSIDSRSTGNRRVIVYLASSENFQPRNSQSSLEFPLECCPIRKKNHASAQISGFHVSSFRDKKKNNSKFGRLNKKTKWIPKSRIIKQS